MLFPAVIAIQAVILFTGFVLAIWIGAFALRFLLPLAVIVFVMGPLIGGLYEWIWHRTSAAGRADLAYRASVGDTGLTWVAKGCALPMAFACVPLVIVAILAVIIRVADAVGF
jgi:hypothetical protein